MPIGFKRKALAKIVRKVRARRGGSARSAQPKAAAKAGARPLRRWVKRARPPKPAQPTNQALAVHVKHDASISTKPLALPYNTQKCNIMNGVSRLSITQYAGYTYVLIAQWSPSKYRLHSWYNNNSGSTGGPVMGDPLPCYGTETPETLRHMKMTLKIRNTTRSDQVGGVVRFLVITEWSPLTTTGDGTAAPLQPNLVSSTNWQNIIRGSNLTRTKTAAELRSTMSFPIVPGHRIAHESFQKWLNPTTMGHFAEMMNTQGSLEATCPLAILFEPTEAPQSWDIALHCQDACQYEAKSALNLMAYTPPLATDVQWQHQRQIMADIAANGDYDQRVQQMADTIRNRRLRHYGH